MTAAKTDEKALAPKGLGMGGLGDFSEADLEKALVGADAPGGTATGDDIRDAMGNIRPKLETVKVKGHGANLFQREDGSQVPGEKGLLGVIVTYTRHNSWFAKSFEETDKGDLPACFSNDGANVAPGAEDSQSEKGCTVCPRNRDATDKDARDAAFDQDQRGKCNNYLSLCVALPGEEVPVRVRLTSSSFRNWAAYIQAIGTKGRFRTHEVATRITLQNVVKDNEFSVAKFEKVGPLPEELRAQFDAQRENYRALLQRTAEKDERDGQATDDGRDAMKQAEQTAGSEDAGL